MTISAEDVMMLEQLLEHLKTWVRNVHGLDRVYMLKDIVMLESYIENNE